MKKLLFSILFYFLVTVGHYSISHANIVDELTKLNNLYKEGAISKEEFQKAKTILFKSENVSMETNKDNKKGKEIKKEEKVKKEIKKEEKVKKEIKKEEKVKKEPTKKTTFKKEKTKKKINKAKVKVRKFDEDLSKTFVSMEDINNLGTFKKIEVVPDGYFDSKYKSFKARATKSMEDMFMIFVKQKGLMEKYPERMMKAMGYFEFFYMDQLREKERIIQKYKSLYPNIPGTYSNYKKEMKSLHSLNEARITMRKSMGLTLDDSPEKALQYYITMHNFLSKSEKKQNKLTSRDKKIKKESDKFKKHYGSFKKNVTLKSERRITNKEFQKELNKNVRDVKKTLMSMSKIDNKKKGGGSNEDKDLGVFFETIGEMFEESVKLVRNCSDDCQRKELLTVLDTIDFTNTTVADIEKQIVKKRWVQDMSKVDFKSFGKYQLNLVKEVSSNMKDQKALKKRDLQRSILNLENNNYPVNEFLDKIEDEGFKVDSISMSFDNIKGMERWAMKDWANSWRGPLPKEIKDKAGNLVEFSEENINDIKAQMAMNNFADVVETASSDIKVSMNENIEEVIDTVKSSGAFNIDSWLARDFSITLDNYSSLVGNAWGMDLKNFQDLTDFANKYYGTNVSAADYQKVYESASLETGTKIKDVVKGLELMSELDSFNAAAVAKELGADLQTVADTIAEAASAGIGTDLEAAAKGLGYDSFADAVAAYNAQYGTNYSVDEAREALGNN